MNANTRCSVMHWTTSKRGWIASKKGYNHWSTHTGHVLKVTSYRGSPFRHNCVLVGWRNPSPPVKPMCGMVQGGLRLRFVSAIKHLKRTLTRSIVCWRDEVELGKVADAYRRLRQIPLPADNAEFARVCKENFGAITGTPDQIIPEFKAYEEAGIEEVMLQYLPIDGLELLEAIAGSVLPYFQNNI